MRPPGRRLSVTERLRLAVRIREQLAKHPTATMEELQRATGAPLPVIREVRDRVRRVGT